MTGRSEATVRRARPGDAGDLARLRHEFRTSLEPATEPEAAFLDRCARWMSERLAASDRRWRCWVLEVRGEIRGHAWLSLIEKVPNPVAEVETHAYLTNMYVREQDRGLGGGTSLLEAAIDWCRGRDIGSIVLWPTDRSRPLYERFGFRATDDVYELTLKGEDER